MYRYFPTYMPGFILRCINSISKSQTHFFFFTRMCVRTALYKHKDKST